jgi:hypothetical protein
MHGSPRTQRRLCHRTAERQTAAANEQSRRDSQLVCSNAVVRPVNQLGDYHGGQRNVTRVSLQESLDQARIVLSQICDPGVRVEKVDQGSSSLCSYLPGSGRTSSPCHAPAVSETNCCQSSCSERAPVSAPQVRWSHSLPGQRQPCRCERTVVECHPRRLANEQQCDPCSSSSEDSRSRSTSAVDSALRRRARLPARHRSDQCTKHRVDGLGC